MSDASSTLRDQQHRIHALEAQLAASVRRETDLRQQVAQLEDHVGIAECSANSAWNFYAAGQRQPGLDYIKRTMAGTAPSAPAEDDQESGHDDENDALSDENDALSANSVDSTGCCDIPHDDFMETQVQCILTEFVSRNESPLWGDYDSLLYPMFAIIKAYPARQRPRSDALDADNDYIKKLRFIQIRECLQMLAQRPGSPYVLRRWLRSGSMRAAEESALDPVEAYVQEIRQTLRVDDAQRRARKRKREADDDGAATRAGISPTRPPWPRQTARSSHARGRGRGGGSAGRGGRTGGADAEAAHPASRPGLPRAIDRPCGPRAPPSPPPTEQPVAAGQPVATERQARPWRGGRGAGRGPGPGRGRVLFPRQRGGLGPGK